MAETEIGLCALTTGRYVRAVPVECDLQGGVGVKPVRGRIAADLHPYAAKAENRCFISRARLKPCPFKTLRNG
jgi:hypothetical protein